MNGPLRAAIRADIDAESTDPHETLLSEQLDNIRDTGKGKPPAVNLPVFEAFLGSLPRSASGVIRFRAKANIGLQHLQAGDHEAAARWLLDAYDEAPTDHRAIANKALALWLKGEFEPAYRYGQEQLASDPTNQVLAGYLPQIAASVPEVADGLGGVPEQLKSTEPVALAHIQFLRMRDARPDWWTAAREASARHPESKTLRVLSAVADVDEIARDEEFQRKRYVSPDQRATLRGAVAILDPDWESKIWLLSNPYDDALNIFAAALVAHFFLNDTNRTIQLVEHLVNAGVSNSAVLLDAANMAHSLGNTPLAKRVIACAPDDPQLMFPAAAIAMEEGDWGAAAGLLQKAVIPDTEQHITKIILRLAPLVEARKKGELDDPAPTLKEILTEAQGSPRSLVLVAGVATKLGSRRLGQRAFKAAVDAVTDDSHIATRLMVAAYAERVRSSAGVIRLLDGHLPADGFERDHERLAVAHANEKPHRKRNLTFFQQLSPELLKRREIARAHANVLLNVGLLRDALPLLRKLHNDDPTDTFITLRLLDALRRAGDKSGFSAVLRKLDLSAADGQPLQVMSLASLIAREGETERAYAKAYDLVRSHPTDPNVVLGYMEIGILSGASDFGAQPAAVEVGTGVWLKGPGGAIRTYLIDEDQDFFSVQVIPPGNPMARRLIGKAKGEFAEIPKMGFPEPERWIIEDVANKYDYLHRQILENFERRFPGQNRLASFVMEDGDIQPVLDAVRRHAEHRQSLVQAYIEKELPLAFFARLLGGDVSSFAAFVRQMGADVVTCNGSSDERVEAIGRAERAHGSGAVLDPYTAIVAADLGVLRALKEWFGSISTPSSTIDQIERLIASESEGLGRRQHSISWHKGEFFRHETGDEQRIAHIERLSAIKANIVEHVDVRPVLVPDIVSPDVVRTLHVIGSEFFDAGFLAAGTGSVLLSDDKRYRDLCEIMLGTKGVWLQAALQAGLENGALGGKLYTDAVVGLAARRHSHVALTGPTLFLIACNDDESLSNLRTALTQLGGAKAQITSHLIVLREFLNLLWVEGRNLPLVTIKAATSAALDAIIVGRHSDGQTVLRSALWQIPALRSARDHSLAWLTGHFIRLDTDTSSAEPPPRLSPAAGRPPPTKRARRRKRRHGGK